MRPISRDVLESLTIAHRENQSKVPLSQYIMGHLDDKIYWDNTAIWVGAEIKAYLEAQPCELLSSS